jgi:hypothetical protein
MVVVMAVVMEGSLAALMVDSMALLTVERWAAHWAA